MKHWAHIRFETIVLTIACVLICAALLLIGFWIGKEYAQWDAIPKLKQLTIK